MRKRYHDDGCGKGFGLFAGGAAAQHDDADGGHQQGQPGDDQAAVILVKQGAAQQGGVREFPVVYFRADGGAFRIEVCGTLGGEGREGDGRCYAAGGMEQLVKRCLGDGIVRSSCASAGSNAGFLRAFPGKVVGFRFPGIGAVLADLQIVPRLFRGGHRAAVRFLRAGQGVDDADELAQEEAGNDDADGDGDGPPEGGGFPLHVQQHDDEREEHHDGSGVYQNLENAQEVGAQPDHNGGRGSEGEGHHHGGGNGVAHEDDHQGQEHGQGPEDVKEYVTGKNVHNVRKLE